MRHSQIVLTVLMQPVCSFIAKNPLKMPCLFLQGSGYGSSVFPLLHLGGWGCWNAVRWHLIPFFNTSSLVPFNPSCLLYGECAGVADAWPVGRGLEKGRICTEELVSPWNRLKMGNHKEQSWSLLCFCAWSSKTIRVLACSLMMPLLL